MYTYTMREGICKTNFAKFINIGSKSTKEKPVFTSAEIGKIEADPSKSAKL